MIQLLSQLTRSAQVDIQLFYHMNGQTNGTGLIHDRPLNGLTNPPGGIGRKAEAALRVKLLHGTDQSQVTLFDQIQQRQAAIDIAAGNLDHQAQVAFDHALATCRITLLRQTRKMDLFFRSQQGRKTDFVQIQLSGIQLLGKFEGIFTFVRAWRCPASIRSLFHGALLIPVVHFLQVHYIIAGLLWLIVIIQCHWYMPHIRSVGSPALQSFTG